MSNATDAGVLIVCSCGRRVRPATSRNGKCPGCGKKLPGVTATAESRPRRPDRLLGLLLVLLLAASLLLSI